MEEFVKQLNTLLKKKKELDHEISDLINRRYDGKVRVSAKKLVADLGEFYVLKSLPFITDLEQLRASNADCDLIGEVSEELREKWMLKSRKVRIEVKTRYAQDGDNQFQSVKIDKFDLLAFVSLDKDYRCHHIGLIRAEDLVLDKYLRTSYSKYWPNKVVWHSNDWERKKF